MLASQSSLNIFDGVEDYTTHELVNNAIRLQLWVSEDELLADLAQYDNLQGASPPVALCRKYVRKMFDTYQQLRVDNGLAPIPPWTPPAVP